jgi:small ligand-binding sensory domain FIST
MRFVSVISENKNPALAAKTMTQQVLKQLDGRPCHAVFLFVSALYETDWKPILAQIRRELDNPLLLGCTAGGVLGTDQELEFTPAMSLAAAYLPRVELHPFRISPEDLEEDHGTGFWIEKAGVNPAQEPVGILIPEPYSCDCMPLVTGLNAAYPKMPLIGGLASGGTQAGENALFLNDEVIREGAVGWLLIGDVKIQTIVSQGCRPLGRPFIVTKAQENALLELAGVPALEALQQLFQTLSPADKSLAQRALLLGVVMDERKEKFGRGDFLIRNIIGIDPGSGIILVGDKIQVGQTVQFQVRDANTAREDLQHLLKENAPELTKSPPAGALLFSCLGRGRDLYGEPNYDIRTIGASVSACPIAGFFCNGEIGPVGGHNFIHGFTSSLGLFRPR